MLVWHKGWDRLPRKGKTVNEDVEWQVTGSVQMIDIPLR